MALRIEDPGSLPGREVVDQEGETVGEIKEVYGLGDDGDPMWVVIETSTGGMGGDDKLKFVPLARLREDGDDLSVPYSKGHVERSPEVEVGDEISEEDERELRVYYSIDLADQEFRSEPRSYASQVPEGEGPSRKVTDDLESKGSEDGSESSSSDDSESDDESRGSDDSESGEESRGSDDSESGEESRDSDDRSDSGESEDADEGSGREGEDSEDAEEGSEQSDEAESKKS